MTAQTGVKWVLRFIAVLSSLALIGIVIPPSWLAWFLQKAQPGTPNGILTNYLFRMLNVMYAWVGVQCWIYSTDVRRYLVLIWITGVGSLVLSVLGLALLFLSAAPAGQDWFFWVVFADLAEGFVQAVLLVILLRQLGRGASTGPGLRTPVYSAKGLS